MLNRLTWEVLIISLCFWGFTCGEIFEECGEREGLYISSDLGCSYYIFCYGEDSFIEQCDEDNPYFSETDQTCDSEPGVCHEETGESSSSASTPAIEVEEQSSVAVDPLSTISTLNPKLNTTTATTPISTPVTTTIASTTTMVSLLPSTVSTAATHLGAQCPLSDDPREIVFLADTKSCANYFMCYHGEPVAMHCSNMLHFDHKSRKCDYPENVKCQLDTSSAHEKCQNHTFDVFSHPSNCNYYYLCRYGYLMVMQCPLNMDWDYVKRACLRRGTAKCSKSSVKTYKRM